MNARENKFLAAFILVLACAFPLQAAGPAAIEGAVIKILLKLGVVDADLNPAGGGQTTGAATHEYVNVGTTTKATQVGEFFAGLDGGLQFGLDLDGYETFQFYNRDGNLAVELGGGSNDGGNWIGMYPPPTFGPDPIVSLSAWGDEFDAGGYIEIRGTGNGFLQNTIVFDGEDGSGFFDSRLSVGRVSSVESEGLITVYATGHPFAQIGSTAGGIQTVGSVAAGAGIHLGTGGAPGDVDDPSIYSGSGSPEGEVSAPPGSLYLRRDGGAGSALYVKESGTGNTGWVAK